MATGWSSEYSKLTFEEEQPVWCLPNTKHPLFVACDPAHGLLLIEVLWICSEYSECEVIQILNKSRCSAIADNPSGMPCDLEAIKTRRRQTSQQPHFIFSSAISALATPAGDLELHDLEILRDSLNTRLGITSLGLELTIRFDDFDNVKAYVLHNSLDIIDERLQEFSSLRKFRSSSACEGGQRPLRMKNNKRGRYGH